MGVEEPGQDRDLSNINAARYKRDYYVHQGGNNNNSNRKIDTNNYEIEMKLSRKKVRKSSIIIQCKFWHS